MQPHIMLISIALLMWSASQVQAQRWIQPSPSIATGENVAESTPSIQTKLSRGSCSYYEVACRNSGQCIFASWVCDQWPDCADWSDEIGCSNFSMSMYFWYGCNGIILTLNRYLSLLFGLILTLDLITLCDDDFVANSCRQLLQFCAKIDEALNP